MNALKVLSHAAADVWQIRRRVSDSSLIRVLHLIETGGPGGAERMLLSLAGNLGDGYESTVGLGRPGWLQAQVKSSGLSCELVGGNGLGDLGVITTLTRLARIKNIDVIHAHEFYMNAIGSVVSSLTGVPLIATVHGKSYYPEKRRRCAAYRMVAVKAGRMVVVSQDLKSFFCRSTGIQADRVQVVYNGIDSQPLSGFTRDPELLRSCGIPRDALIVGTVGNLYPVKGHIHLIRAIPMILKQRSNTHIVILGRGAQDELLRSEAVALGVQGHMHLLGYREDTPRWLAAMDIFTLPSLSEGLPLSLLEAMGAGVPVVVTAVGGMPEVVTHGTTGLIVPPADSQALASTISSLLSNRPYAAELGAAGRRLVSEHFSMHRMVQDYQSLYRVLLRDRGGSTG
jgi:glycosyltransferase involved in cell wall biosynthesis